METYSDYPFRRFYLQEGIVRYRRVSKDTKELQKIQKSFKRYERVSKDTEEFQKDTKEFQKIRKSFKRYGQDCGRI